ncbi:MAG: hypothetical protein PCFJNLEI_04179 [Verrucomicrobiae bacterium]|nr:hypothetical protein [Verrucomicrobiae bacterium]
MAKWNLSAEDEKAREAAFEAKLLAELRGVTPKPQPPPPPSPVTATTDGIQISVTASGQTTHFNSLASVPLPVRQRILNAWMAAPALRTETPTPPVARPRTRSAAVAMNLFLPGAGQFYLGQPGWGCFYALSFLVCFAAMIVIFIRGYLALDLNGDIFATGTLEKLMETFQAGTLIALQIVALVIYLASTAHLFLSRPRD